MFLKIETALTPKKARVLLPNFVRKLYKSYLFLGSNFSTCFISKYKYCKEVLKCTFFIQVQRQVHAFICVKHRYLVRPRLHQCHVSGAVRLGNFGDEFHMALGYRGLHLLRRGSSGCLPSWLLGRFLWEVRHSFLQSGAGPGILKRGAQF